MINSVMFEYCRRPLLYYQSQILTGLTKYTIMFKMYLGYFCNLPLPRIQPTARYQFNSRRKRGEGNMYTLRWKFNVWYFRVYVASCGAQLHIFVCGNIYFFFTTISFQFWLSCSWIRTIDKYLYSRFVVTILLVAIKGACAVSKGNIVCLTLSVYQ